MEAEENAISEAKQLSDQTGGRRVVHKMPTMYRDLQTHIGELMGGACTHTHTHTNTHAHTQVYGACYFRCVQVAARIWLPNCSWMPPYFLLNWFQWHAAFCSYSKLQKSRAVSMSGNAVACMVSCIVGFMLLTQHMPLWTY